LDFKSNYSHAYSFHKLIVDKEGRPIDCEFIEVNKAFENLTGLKSNQIIGKKISEVLMEIDHHFKCKWFEVTSYVALTGNEDSFQHYSATSDRWYQVEVFSYKQGFFAAIINDITAMKLLQEQGLFDKNKALSQLHEALSATEKELKLQIKEFSYSSLRLRESEKKLSRAQTLAHVGNWEIDLKSQRVMASTEALNIYGLHQDENNLPLEKIRKIVRAKDRNRMDCAMQQLLDGTKEYDVTFRIITADSKQERYIHSVAEVEYDHLKKPIRVLGVIQDITQYVLFERDLKEKNRELREIYEELALSEEELRQQFDELINNKELMKLSEERYKTLVNSSYDLIYSCDCKGIFTTINQKVCELFDLPAHEVKGKSIMQIYGQTSNTKKFKDMFLEVIREKRAVSMESEFVGHDGKTRYFDVTLSPLFDTKNKVVGVLGTNHDITQRKENEHTIKHMAYHDFLTNLPNRFRFLDRLKKAITDSSSRGTNLAIVILDLDNFKSVNDTLGHDRGDELLVETAKRLQTCLGDNDTLARLGGDEFAFLIDINQEQECVVPLLERIKMTFDEPFKIKELKINLTTSIGVSLFPQDGDSNEELIKNADTALYEAKGSGRNDYQFFKVQMKEDLVRKTTIMRSLRTALTNEEFVLYYQPQYSFESEELRGFEALLRLNSSEIGFLHPMEFIPIAEETGLILPIGEWVLDQALRACKMLEEKYECDLIMAVNFSPLQLKQKGFHQMVLKAIEDVGLKPTSLEIEVTESIFIESYDAIAYELDILKQQGVGIALDDFGTGYSSLSYLKKLPISLLKIDKSFVDQIDVENPDQDLVESIIALVKKLNIKTIAEGVETLEQLNYLKTAKCDHIQGYYLGRPGPEETIREVIGKGGLQDFCFKSP
jgi:diguanylate cyclase (GGDEF)-like protein/PAS domain S-box-containing protein